MLGQKRNYKIKRYRNIYPQHSTAKSALKVLAVCCVIAALGWVGWIAYEPVGEYLNRDAQAPTSPSSQVQSSAAENQSSAAAGAEASSTAGAVSSAAALESTENPPAVAANLKGIYAPTDLLLDAQRLDAFLQKVSKTDVNSVLFDIKDKTGMVLYASSQMLVENAGSQAKTPYDLREVVKALKSYGLTPIARMHSFADVTAVKLLEKSGVHYLNTDLLWLDESPENGGKPWLNPYSNVAQAYLVDIAAEAASAGVKHLLLDSVTFPTGVGQAYANYGENAAAYSRAQALEGYVDLVEERLQPLGCTVSVLMSGRDALGENDQLIGINPLSLSSMVAVDTAPAGLLLSTLEGLPDNMLELPYDTVKRLLEGISPDIGGKTLVALVQAYTATGNLPNNKVYGKSEILEQVRALSDSGITSYIYYHPQGSYDALLS